MSYELRNDIISNSNSDIMEYLVQKLESRERNLYWMALCIEENFVMIKFASDCPVKILKLKPYMN